MRSRPHQQPAPARRRERHRDLQLRVIAAAGSLVGFGPAAVEDVFAARVALEVAGRGAKQRAVRVFDQQVLNMPAGTAAHRFRGLQCRKKTVRQKWIEGIFRIHRLRFVPRVGASVPGFGADVADRVHDRDAQFLRGRTARVRGRAGTCCRAARSWPKALENHLVGPARGALPLALGAHRPGQQRQAGEMPRQPGCRAPADRRRHKRRIAAAPSRPGAVFPCRNASTAASDPNRDAAGIWPR